MAAHQNIPTCHLKPLTATSCNLNNSPATCKAACAADSASSSDPSCCWDTATATAAKRKLLTACKESKSLGAAATASLRMLVVVAAALPLRPADAGPCCLACEPCSCSLSSSFAAASTPLVCTSTVNRAGQAAGQEGTHWACLLPLLPSACCCWALAAAAMMPSPAQIRH